MSISLSIAAAALAVSVLDKLMASNSHFVPWFWNEPRTSGLRLTITDADHTADLWPQQQRR